MKQHSSKTVEWNTPNDPYPYLDMVREVLGTIDFDPASNEAAQRTIQARIYYTWKDDGFHRRWFGNVFLNPPYGKTGNVSNQERWSQKLIREYVEGRVEQAIMLVNANTGTAWFQRLFTFTICFVNHRIAFVDANGKQQTQPTKDNAFVYLGHQKARFGEVFSRIGTIR